MGAAPVQDETKVAVARRRLSKPRIFLIEPRRLFVDAMLRLLETDFEIVGTSNEMRDACRENALDVILVDTNCDNVPEAVLIDISLRTGGRVCVLTPRARVGIQSRGIPSWATVIPKTLSPRQFNQTLLQLTTLDDACAKR